MSGADAAKGTNTKSVSRNGGILVRGRKPLPTRLHVLHGNPSKKRLNEAEPEHPSIDPACPDELRDPIARAEWDRIVPALAHGHVTTVDRATLIGYCVKWGQFLAADAEASKHPLIVRSASGSPIPNPALKISDRAMALMLKAAAELGITPSSRSRIVAAPTFGPHDDAFTRFQRQRDRS